MTKRSRKSASGKANVVRRSSLKTTPVFARDPMSLDRSALRRNVRTTLLVGTALGASLMAMSLLGSETANAAVVCAATTPAASGTPATYTVDQPAGIYCTFLPADPTVVVNASGGSLGGNQAPGNGGDGSGLEVLQVGVGGVTGSSVTITNSDAIGNKDGVGTFQNVIGNGIEVVVNDSKVNTPATTLTDTVIIGNTGPIGVTGTPVSKAGITSKSVTTADYTGAAATITAGSATNTTTITNNAPIFSVSTGIDGKSTSYSRATNNLATGTAAAGPTTAAVVITNGTTVGTGSAINSTSFGIIGGATAISDGTANGLTGTGNGGVAAATTSITNNDKVTSTTTGLSGGALADASGAAPTATKGTASGGTATATVITANNKSGVLSSGGDGIFDQSISHADATAYFSTGGKSTASTTITNLDKITSVDIGVNGIATATANATVLTPVVPGAPNAGSKATAGIATATVLITNDGANAAPITTKGVNQDGISGVSLAQTNATAFVAKGGSAVAGTTINNGANGTIDTQGAPPGVGIFGSAKAQADATSVVGPGAGAQNAKGSATGGNATATVSISNAGAVLDARIVSPNDPAIWGSATADPSAFGYTAIAGTGTALSTVINSGALIHPGDGIRNGAIAISNAYGYSNTTTPVSPLTGGKGVGGLDIATSLTTNSGTIGVKPGPGEGISGYAFAQSKGYGFTAIGGTAIATTTIVNSNTGTITNYAGDGITGRAGAYAQGYVNGLAANPNLNPNVPPGHGLGSGVYTKGSSGTGGQATAIVTITNAAGIQATGSGLAASPPDFPADLNPFGTGIHGQAIANSSANGATAVAGTASAITTITNSGAIQANVSGVYAGDGIHGLSIAYANAVGDGTVAIKGTAKGGLAVSTTTINNTLAAPATGVGIAAYGGNGIYGRANAFASGHAFSATGGKATATTTITNTAVIWSDDGIDGFATAIASGIAPNFADPSSGTGGTASALTTIGNSNTINATFGAGGYGIKGIAIATAQGIGHQGTGGIASATTTISNTGTIQSTKDGVRGVALSYADGFGYKGITGKAIGGTAISLVNITNTSTANIYSHGGNGINGISYARANGLIVTGTAVNGNGVYNPTGVAAYGNGTGGTASATTTINNAANIFAYGGGFAIAGYAGAKANGTRVGGIANAAVNISNTGATLIGGVFSNAKAQANGGYQGGQATATSGFTNNAFIASYGLAKAGIFTGSNAQANAAVLGGKGGTASASTTVTNNKKVLTFGLAAAGVLSYSYASAVGINGTASANTSVTNSTGAVINTVGLASAGILAGSMSTAGTLLTGNANATTNVNNGGAITTTGLAAVGIAAGSLSRAGGTSTATTNVTNTGGVLTSGLVAPGIVAGSVATGVGLFGVLPAQNATANVTVANVGTVAAPASIKTRGLFLDPGIVALAVSNGYASSAAYAHVINDPASIVTYGAFSAGITAISLAIGVGISQNAAYAHTVVYNSNDSKIVTYGNNSAGINAIAVAIGDAKAVTDVTNAGLITTVGNFSPGIYASSGFGVGSGNSILGIPLPITVPVFAASGSAVATTLVTNSGAIVTYGSTSPGIVANAGAVATLGPAFSSATVTVVNTGSVITNGPESPAISATVFGDSGITITNKPQFVTNAGVVTQVAGTGVLKANDWPWTVIELNSKGGLQSTITNTINNNAGGLIYGNIQSTGVANVTFNNAGTWNMVGSSNFGSALQSTNTVNNTGVAEFLVTDGSHRRDAGVGVYSVFVPDPNSLMSGGHHHHHQAHPGL